MTSSWRNFQSEYLVKKKKKESFLLLLKAGIGLSILVLVISGISIFKAKTRAMIPPHDIIMPPDLPRNDKTPPFLLKTQLTDILRNTQIFNTDKNIFFIDTPGDNYKITTSIDIYLQEYLLSLLDRLRGLTRGKPQRIAMVVMQADTGKIIAMAGFDLDDPKINPCIASDYPAASVFKIITAAAAVETLGYTPETKLYFNGSRYTLYKRQLRDVKNKYTYKITFSRAFAESVNPVFGKIGKNYLGGKKLESYAMAFGFNQVIHSELPFVSGHFKTGGSGYHLAELGCGFNHETTISPVFGAMLVSTALNNGRLLLPSIVEHVTNSNGEIIYKNKKTTYKTAIKPTTALTMMQLFKTTITRGTARKTFRGASRDKVLSKLIIGGKTGSLYNTAHTVKYDWFTGFGQEKKTRKKIVLSIVVGHRKYIGTKACSYAKMILKQYFKPGKNTMAAL